MIAEFGVSQKSVVKFAPSAMRSQRGAALLISLMLLLGLTVVGIASMRESVMQQKVVNAVLEDATAFQSSEYALRVGEQFVQSRMRELGEPLQPGAYTADGVTLNVIDRLGDAEVLPVNWWKDRDSSDWDHGVGVDADDGFYQVGSDQRAPSYIVERLGADDSNVQIDNKQVNTVVYYRITARGFGGNDAYYSVVQSTVGIQL